MGSKTAGLLQAPPATVKAITTWVQAVAAANRLQSLGAEERQLQPYLQSGIDPMPSNGTAKVFKLDLTGWKYGDADLWALLKDREVAQVTKNIESVPDYMQVSMQGYIDRMKLKLKDLQSGSLRSITVVLNSNFHAYGQFDPGNWQLHLRVAAFPSLQEIKERTGLHTQTTDVRHPDKPQ